MKGTAVVTGAAGFIGSHLVDLLLTKGYAVIGIDNLRTGTLQNIESPLKHPEFKFIKEDLCNKEFPDLINDKIDVIFHLAAISSVKLAIESPILVNDTNVHGTINVLEMARRLDVKRIVYSSSAAVYGDPESLPVREDTPLNPLGQYAASKISAEMYCLSYGNLYGITPTIFRYFNVYGPRQETSEYSGVVPIFINKGFQNKDIVIDGDGGQTRSFIYVNDVVEATYLGSKLDGKEEHILNLSGSDSISILDLAHLVKELIPASTSNIVHRDAREGDVRDSIGSMEKTSSVLSFSPSVPFKNGLERTVAWYKPS
jgi:UDP-glucose 4-epimerase